MQKRQYRHQMGGASFEPIQIPDNSHMILQEMKYQLAGMQDVANAQKESRDAVLRNKKDQEQKQQIFRDKEVSLQNTYAQAFKQAAKVRYDVEKENIRVEERQNADEREKWDKVKELSKTALDTYLKFETQRTPEIVAKGYELASRYDLTPQELLAFKNGDRNNLAVETAFTAVQKRMELMGATPQEIKYVMDLSGREMQGAMEYSLSRAGGDAWKNYLTEKHPVKIPGLNRSLADIEGDDTKLGSKDYQVALRFWETQYISKFTGIGNAGNGFSSRAITLHMRPGMHKLRKELETKQAERDRGTLVKLQDEKDTTLIKAALFKGGGTDPGQNFLDTIGAMAGGKPEYMGDARRKGIRILTSMAKSGELKPEVWTQIKNTEIEVAGKKVLWGVQYEKDIGIVDDALHDRVKLVQETREREYDIFNQEVLSAYQSISIEHKTAPDQRTIQEWKDVYKTRFPEKKELPSWLKNLESRQEVEYNAGKAILEEELLSENGLTMQELFTGHYSQALIAEYYPHVINNPENTKSGYKSTLDNEIAAIRSDVVGSVNKIMPTNSVAIQGDTKRMQNVAERILKTRIKKAIIAGTGTDVGTIIENESRRLRDEIKSQSGIWDVNRHSNNTPIMAGPGRGFRYLSKGWKYNAEGVAYREAANDKAIGGVNQLYTEGFVDETNLKLIHAHKSGSPLPLWVTNTAHDLSIDRYDLANNILAANGYGEKDLIQRPGAAKVVSYVDPMYRKLTERMQSWSRTVRAIEQTDKLHDTEGSKVSTDITQDKATNFVANQNGKDPYDGYITGGPNKKGEGVQFGDGTLQTSITKFTISELSDLSRNNSVISVGAWQIPVKTLVRFTEQGHFTDDTLVDEHVQRRAQELRQYEDSGTFLANDVPIPGVGHNYTTTSFKVSPFSELAYEQYKEDLAKKGWYPFKFKPEVEAQLKQKLGAK